MDSEMTMQDAVQPDWSMCGTKAEILERMDGNFNFSQGWIESKTDTKLIIRYKTRDLLYSYRLCIWNRPGVRAEYAALLGMPVTTVE